MKLTIAFLVGAVICALTPGNATAQGCRLDLAPHYSVYANQSTDGSHISTSVLTDGYANFTPSAGCSGAGAVHTVKSYNLVGSVGGLGTGASGCMTCYFSYENDQTFAATQGITYTFNYSGEMDCTQFGTFFSSGGSIGISLHTIYGANTRGSQIIGDTRFCGMTPACTPPTTAICGNPTFTVAVHPSSNPCYPYDRVIWLKVGSQCIVGPEYPYKGPTGPCD
jgi:hypothetical protein